MRVALVHHWLTTMRGGEKVLEAMADLFPAADIYTLFYDPGKISSELKKHHISSSILNHIPFASRFYPDLLPLYPLGVRSLNTRAYDLILSSDSSLIKGIPVSEGSVHICYCHSPPRYLWNMEELYLANANPLKRTAANRVFPYLRRWDFRAAQRVDHFIANSVNVQERIKLYYRRDASVIYPPVAILPLPVRHEVEDYYLLVGQLVSYKRADVAVEAFNRLQKKLLVVGEGPDLKRLRKLAGPTVQLLGWRSDEEIRKYMAASRALIFPGEEDFGIVPVESQLMGRPVIAYGKGGALETVLDDVTGIFYHDPEPEALCGAVVEFEKIMDKFETTVIRKKAMRFAKEVFIRNMRGFIVEKTGLNVP